MKHKIERKKKKKAKGLSSLPGGGQVDGLPPAASTDTPSLKVSCAKRQDFFARKLINFLAQKFVFLEIFNISRISKLLHLIF